MQLEHESELHLLYVGLDCGDYIIAAYTFYISEKKTATSIHNIMAMHVKIYRIAFI